jgi:hypothetical protein
MIGRLRELARQTEDLFQPETNVDVSLTLLADRWKVAWLGWWRA